MLLAEWAIRHNIQPMPPPPEHKAVPVYVRTDSDAGRQLFHLSDYAVSTVSGPVVWLVPVTTIYTLHATTNPHSMMIRGRVGYTCGWLTRPDEYHEWGLVWDRDGAIPAAAIEMVANVNREDRKRRMEQGG